MSVQVLSLVLFLKLLYFLAEYDVKKKKSGCKIKLIYY